MKAGNRGVHLRFGAVTGRIINPGFYWKIPHVDKIATINVQQSKHQVEVSCYTDGTQTINALIALNYHFDSLRVGLLYEEIGYTRTSRDESSYQSKVIDPKLEDLMKAATPAYDADNIIGKRDEVRDIVRASLTTYLKDYYIIIDSFSLVNFQFLPEYEAAIESKRTAYQKSEEAKFDLVRISTEAEQRVAQAKGEAEAIRIQVESINQAGGEHYVTLQAIKAWEEGGSQVPTVVMGGNSMVPFVDIAAMTK